MQLPEVAIRRPVFATVLSLLILLVGLVSFNNLTVREYPRIDEPTVTVTTRFGGASSEVIESQVTKVLEDSLAGIEGVDIITSISRQEQSQITVRFKLERDPDSAAADVRDKVSRVRQRLPDDVDEPTIAKVEADATPVIWLALNSDTVSQLQLSDLANRLIKPRLQTAPGAADVRIYGERRFSMRVWLDPDRLAAYNLTTQDVEDALRRSNLEVPAGRIESSQREFNVTAATDVQTPEQFRAIGIRTINGQTIRIGDVARVEEGPQDERVSVRYNGRDALSLGVIRQATANPLELSAAVQQMLPRIVEELPPGVSIEVANDNSIFIDRSIKAVYTTIAEAVVLVALVIFVFLRTLRASVIPLITIPVSLIGSFALMGLFGFSINTLTLLALVLAIGLVVDDAIVMLENIYRHIEEGMKPFDAAIKGAREIGFAIVAMTLTLAAVYAPLAFTPGRTGRLFAEFALALAGAVVVSGFVALTLSPMMCSKLLRHVDKPSRFDRFMERVLVRVNNGYDRLLGLSLNVRWLVVGVMLASAGASWWLLSTTRSELAPMEDRGVVLANINGPDGATLAYTRRYVNAIEQMAREQPEFDRIFAVVGNPSVAQGSVTMRGKAWEDRERTTMEIARTLAPRMAALPGISAYPITPPSLGQGFRERPVNFIIVTNDSYENLSNVVRQFQDRMAQNPGLVQVDTDLRLNKPEIRMDVDRERAADMGVSVDTIARTVETMLGGRIVTRYKRDGEQYDVVVQTVSANRSTPEDIDRLFVRGRGDAMIPLASLITTREVVVPRELNHFGQRRSASITANVAPDYSLGEALDFMERTAGEILPVGYATDLNGQSREFRNASGSLALVFVLSLLFIFLVLSAQFESFVDPFIILLSVPLSMMGALLALKLSGGTLNVFSQIGLITLVGLITKHGILIVEFSNQLREQGLEKLDAVKRAAGLRLRPILMTTGAMVLGAIPLALATGAGAESRQQIGWVIVGGMSVGTLLTIFVVPTMYTLLSRRKAGESAHPVMHEEGGRHAPQDVIPAK
ncbi:MULTISPECIES: efflux RND transporter permease subunit [Hydrogenophaga]|uniref:Acriflavin resistance protein n=1 Tax=Hydrogenophaga intermedia TaxID=65786 RepID=A0A1L1PFM1_HYDIT|nr:MULTISPECIES: efflux RND transporter permease subunit [Hydrogenophaga]AOS78909.1 multidrug transporter AcrB [Hydrogenophaga sp. PBC]TMU74439.1 efflux RND transporter permease subunit [Hydrogenophaga intermedia]CDN88778.1 Acriflavin resistance protein [Hydrogenophaga intermedia]